MTPTAIEFDRVAYVQPSGVPVLEALTLDIRRGEVIALVGRSGAGKTTVLQLVNRLLLPQPGDVLVDGRDTTRVGSDRAAPVDRLCHSGRRAVSAHDASPATSRWCRGSNAWAPARDRGARR